MAALDHATALVRFGLLEDANDDPWAVELTFDTARTRADVTAAVAGALPGHDVEMEAAGGGAEDAIWFVRLTGMALRGHEDHGFALARQLARETNAIEGVLAGSEGLNGDAGLDDPPGVKVSGGSDGPRPPRAWHHDRIRVIPGRDGAPCAWDHTQGEGARIGLIDTGYTHHKDLDDVFEMESQHNVLESGKADAEDPLHKPPLVGRLYHPAHGTLVASVIASRGTTTADGDVLDDEVSGHVTGIAPAAKIIPIRAIRSVIRLDLARIARGIDYAVDKECDVIVLCLGGPFRSRAVQLALKRAAEAGTVTVCAAGNYWPVVVYPARYAPHGLSAAMAATKRNDAPWEWTPRSGHLTAAAPGHCVWGARVDDRKPAAPSTGTTLATSITAGVAALWVAHHGRGRLRAVAASRGMTVQALFNHALIGSAQASAHGPRLGAGIIDARKVLDFDITGGGLKLAALDRRPRIASALELFQECVEAVADASAAAATRAELAGTEEIADELLWRMQKTASVASYEKAAFLAPPTPPLSDEARQVLADRPALRALVGGA